MLLTLGTVIPAGRPCIDPWDFWCGTSSATVDNQLYYINKTAQTDSGLGANLYPVRFSDDGTKALVSKGAVAYIYDMSSLKIIDSFPDGGGGHLLWDTALQRIGPATQASLSQIIITQM